jgi:hypothetical protein
MMISHVILRTTLGNYTMKNFLQFPEYIEVLTLINDNNDGPQGCFSIQNVVRMALIFDKYPGEWHGNKSISLVFSHLNKIYKPLLNFEICLFGDETIYFDKIEKKATQRIDDWVAHKRSKGDKLSQEQRNKLEMIDALF